MSGKRKTVSPLTVADCRSLEDSVITTSKKSKADSTLINYKSSYKHFISFLAAHPDAAQYLNSTQKEILVDSYQECVYKYVAVFLEYFSKEKDGRPTQTPTKSLILILNKCMIVFLNYICRSNS